MSLCDGYKVALFAIILGGFLINRGLMAVGAVMASIGSLGGIVLFIYEVLK